MQTIEGWFFCCCRCFCKTKKNNPKLFCLRYPYFLEITSTKLDTNLFFLSFGFTKQRKYIYFFVFRKIFTDSTTVQYKSPITIVYRRKLPPFKG